MISNYNNIEVIDLLSAPLHICPEWYFLTLYLLLKISPNKRNGWYCIIYFIFITNSIFIIIVISCNNILIVCFIISYLYSILLLCIYKYLLIMYCGILLINYIYLLYCRLLLIIFIWIIIIV